MDDPNQDGPTNDSLRGRQDEDMIYESYDDERERDGVHNRFDAEGARQAADRYELIRKVEDLQQDALDWLEFTDDEDAKTVYDMIVELREVLGEPPEETDA